jgi:hypothetical protein
MSSVNHPAPNRSRFDPHDPRFGVCRRTNVRDESALAIAKPSAERGYVKMILR